jgi:hypothetical protein
VRGLFSLVLAALLAIPCMGQETICENGQCRIVPRIAQATRNFAARLDNASSLYHDTSFVGPEVVFMSSGVATEDQAIAAWRMSPGHNALLPSITEIECVGNACVGRGAGVVNSVSFGNAPIARIASAAKGLAVAPIKFLREKRPLRKLLFGR